MQTDVIYVSQVEELDYIEGDGDATQVIEVREDGDFIILVMADEEGEKCDVKFGPFDQVRLVTSFEDEGESDFEDVPIED